MKNILFILVLGLAYGANLSAQINPVFLEKIYGNAEENRPTVVKAFNDGIYVAGYKVIAGNPYATFSKFDISTGMLVWEKCFELHTRITDFDYEPTQDELFIVGSTEPFSSTFNNESFLSRISGNGNLMDFNRFTQNGRERFERIVRHPNPSNSTAPFYIVGTKNPTAIPSASEVVVLFNVDLNGGMVGGTEYTLTPAENEFARGLIPLSNGDLILMGNDIANNGILLQVNGAGGFVNAYSFPNVLDIYDAIELQNGFLIMAGEDFSVHEAFVVTLNLSRTPAGPQSGLRFQNIFRFNDLWRDQFGKLYAIGENKNVILPTPPLPHPFAKNYQVVHKLNYFEHAGLASLSVDWARYLEDPAETSYSNGNISVTPTHDRIFYADARLGNPSSFGNWDNLVGSFDLDLNSNCRHDFPFPTILFTPTPNSVTVTPLSIPPPPFTSPPIIDACSYGCVNFCGPAPCPCDFTWTTGDCFQVQLDASCPNPIPGVYTYAWDFDCSGGAPDQVTNNAIISHTFPCGGNTHQVCVKITDPFGTQCDVMHSVTVPSTCCGQIVSKSLACAPPGGNQYYFNIVVADPPQAVSPCTYTLTNNDPGTIFTGPVNYVSNGGMTTIDGFIYVPDIIPLNLNFTVQANCVCPSGAPITCTLLVSIPTLCCKRILVPDQVVCESAATFDVPIQLPQGIALSMINTVNWFVMPKPAGGCPPAPWGGTPFQQNFVNLLEPLHLYPASSLSGDLCVYAVVHLNDGPCTMLTSNIAMVQLCGPSTCSLNGYDYCYMGTPIVPGLLTLTLNSPANACTPTVEWLEPNNPNPVQIGGSTYLPTTALSMVNPLVNCYEDFFYTVRITDECGQRDCQARIRLYSDDAPKGSLAIVPSEQLPLCPGGDATVQFTPGCSGLPPGPPSWTWCDSIVGGTWQPLPNGTISLYWNTNPLFQNTWYSVKSQNGVCPEDSVQLKIEVRDPLQITSFIAQYDQPCNPTSVYMEVDFTPLPPDPTCSVTVEWYRDGVLVGVTPPAAPSPASFTYSGPSLAGNYYCVIKNDCCEERDTSVVIHIDPPCFVLIAGPCFICDQGPVDLQAVFFNMPAGTTCTYQWTTSNGTFSGSTTNILVTVTAPGLYIFTATCMDINGVVCTKSATFSLLGCASGQFRSECGVIVSIEELLPKEASPLRIFPNPTSGEVTVEWIDKIPQGTRLFIIDPTGLILRQIEVPDNATSMMIPLNQLPAGMYFIKIESADRQYNVAKIVKN